MMPANFLATTYVVIFSLISSPITTTALGSSSSVAADNNASCKSPPSSTSSLLSPGSIENIAQGGVAIEHNWLPPHLIEALRKDARSLFQSGQFQPDGLTNTAIRDRSEQGFSQKADRQTFRGGADWSSHDVGNASARMEFADRMAELRQELAAGLNRPTLATDTPDQRKHEMTYNWYEPGAKLGRHLDEHHEETKGVKGWMLPTRRSVTWLVYLNEGWKEEEGGALRTLPRPDHQLSTAVQVGAHGGNLQVGWLDERHPVFLDCFSRPSGGAVLYQLDEDGEIIILSSRDFDVPRQPIDFKQFLTEEHQSSFEQISTSRLDPRFAKSATAAATSAKVGNAIDETHALDITPAAGTLVLFDSVTLPHRVKEVTGKRQRIAATGWFHEDSQFVIELE